MGDDPIIGGDYGYSVFDLAQNPLGPGMGKPSGSQRQAELEALMNATRLPMELWNTTGTMRKNVTNTLERFTGGTMDLANEPMFAPGKAAVEDAYTSAKDNILANMPAGGSMQSALTDLEGQRARGMTDVYGKIQEDMFNKAYGAGYGTPQTSIAGANASASNLSNALQAHQASASQNAAGIGELIGYVATK